MLNLDPGYHGPNSHREKFPDEPPLKPGEYVLSPSLVIGFMSVVLAATLVSILLLS